MNAATRVDSTDALTPRYAILIPARLTSSRLPFKLLLAESGKPLIQHVVERAHMAPGRPDVMVCTADGAIEHAVREFGGTVRRTRSDHPSGTSRCAEVAESLDCDVVVNLQGDEPLVVPEDLARVARATATVDMATLATPFANAEEAASPSAVKAIRDDKGMARGFQRAYPARLDPGTEVLHHVGIYAFRRSRLVEFATLPETEGERRERLEQLRALEHGWRIRVIDATDRALGIDTRADYDRFLARLAAARDVPRRD